MDSKREGNLGHTVGVKLGRFSFVLAALFLVASFAAPADAGVQWVTKQVGWAGPGAAGSFGGGNYDTLFITDEADTQRTQIISTSDWAWNLGMPGGTVATPVDMAIVTVIADLNNGTADSLYAQLEKCSSKGQCGMFAGSGAAFVTPSFFLPAIGTFAAGKIVFRGVIQADPLASGVAAGTLWLDPAFRIKLVGDVGGTTPKLSGCRIYLTYPKYVAGS